MLSRLVLKLYLMMVNQKEFTHIMACHACLLVDVPWDGIYDILLGLRLHIGG